MEKVVLNVSIDKEIKERAEALCLEYGFSSLPELIRALLTKFSNQELTLKLIVTEGINELSKNTELMKTSQKNISKRTSH